MELITEIAILKQRQTHPKNGFVLFVFPLQNNNHEIEAGSRIFNTFAFFFYFEYVLSRVALRVCVQIRYKLAIYLRTQTQPKSNIKIKSNSKITQFSSLSRITFCLY